MTRPCLSRLRCPGLQALGGSTSGKQGKVRRAAPPNLLYQVRPGHPFYTPAFRHTVGHAWRSSLRAIWHAHAMSHVSFDNHGACHAPALSIRHPWPQTCPAPSSRLCFCRPRAIHLPASGSESPSLLVKTPISALHVNQLKRKSFILLTRRVYIGKQTRLDFRLM